MKDLILTIDVGTQSIRSGLIDPGGKIVAIKRNPIESYFSPKPGWAEQHPAYFWEQLCLSTRSLLEENKPNIDRIAGVTLTTQRSTVITVDSKGVPLRPAIVWPDQRREKDFLSLGLFFDIGFKIIGMYETVKYAQAEAEINWLRKNQPEIVKKTFKYLYLSGFITYKLTGLFRDSYAAQVGYIPFDYKHFKWSPRFSWKWKAFPVPKEMLPELVPPGEILGEIIESASKETGIPEGLPVIAAGSDKACELVGAGCVSPDIAGISFGTTATVSVNIRKYTEVIPFIPPYPSVIRGMYSPEVQIYRGFWLVSWFKKEFGTKEILQAEREGRAVEELFEKLIREVPPGSHGLILQPYWSPGVKVPGPEAKGAIIGFGEIHTRSHLYRAIIEGLCYALREGAEKIQRRSGIRVRELRASGGGAQSDSTLQIASDIFNISVKRPGTFETSSLGAAIVATPRLGLHSDVFSAIKEMTSTTKIFYPNRDASKIYNELYSKIYKHLYKHLRHFYYTIQRITRYPDI